MRISRGLIAFAACLSLSAPAVAATLGAVQGSVMVNRGGGYRIVQGATQLKPGDLVLVNPGGSAQISYPDGCSVSAQVGAVVTIGEQSPCAAQAGPLGTTGVFILNAGVAAGTVGAFLVNQNDKDKPASP